MEAATSVSAETLRTQMVDRVLTGHALTPRVEAALRRVERHRYVPEASLSDAYDETSVITRTFPDGTHASCASEPGIVAAMLDALDVQPGHRILEIGAGTGYNAALLATLAGPEGQVVTLDIDPEVTAGACGNLDATGFGDVVVLTRDGARGAAEHAPFDRIIVAVGAWDLPSTWWGQLVPAGRLVVPLRWRGTTRAVAFVKQDDHWASDWVLLCGFVPMVGQPGERATTIDPEGLVTLHHDSDQHIDQALLQGVLGEEQTTIWAGATVGGEESFDRIWLRLAATANGTVRIQADRRAVDSGLCTPAIPVRSPALVDGDSLAYFTIRRASHAPGRWQLGAIGHGRSGRRLAQRVVDQIDVWDTARTTDPEILAYPTTLSSPPTPDPSLGEPVVKPGIHLFLRY